LRIAFGARGWEGVSVGMLQVSGFRVVSNDGMLQSVTAQSASTEALFTTLIDFLRCLAMDRLYVGGEQFKHWTLYILRSFCQKRRQPGAILNSLRVCVTFGSG